MILALLSVAGFLPATRAVPTDCGSDCFEVVHPTSHDLSAGATAGIVVGVVLFAVIACSLLVWWARYRRHIPSDGASECSTRSASFEALPSDGELDTVHGHGHYYLQPDVEKELPAIPSRNPTQLERGIIRLCEENPPDLRKALIRLFDADTKTLRYTAIEAQVRRLIEAPPLSPTTDEKTAEQGPTEELQDPEEEENARLIDDIRIIFRASQRHSSVNIPTPSSPVMSSVPSAPPVLPRIPTTPF